MTGSPYTRAISAGILGLQESGTLQKLKTKWWKEMHGGGQCVVSYDFGLTVELDTFLLYLVSFFICIRCKFFTIDDFFQIISFI